MNDEGSFEQAMRLAAKRRLENAPKAKTEAKANVAEARTPSIAQERKTMTANTAAIAKTESKKAAKATGKSSSNGQAKTPSANGVAKPASTLTRPQVRVLAALAKAKRPLNKAEIAAAAGVSLTWVVGFTRQACKANKTPSLAEQGFAKAREIGGDDVAKEWVYEITASGRKAMERELKNAAK